MAKFLIDFDGTCVPILPKGTKTKYSTGASQVLKSLIKAGHEIYLWTARNHSDENPWNYEITGIRRKEDSLDEAIRWFSDNGIKLSGINEVPGEISEIGISRKALGDYLIDDTALGVPIKTVTVELTSKDKISTYHVDWEQIEGILYKRGLLRKA